MPSRVSSIIIRCRRLAAHAGLRINDMGTQRTGNLPDAQLKPFAERGLFTHPRNSSLKSLRSRWLPFSSRISQYALHLGELLFRGHACQQSATRSCTGRPASL